MMNLAVEGSELEIVGRVGGDRELTTRNVGNIDGLFNAVSNY